MEIEQEDNSQTSKKQRNGVEGELVKVTKAESKNRQMKVKGPSFEIKEYAFLETPKASTHKFKTRAELVYKYRDEKETPMVEYLKLYVEVR